MEAILEPWWEPSWSHLGAIVGAILEEHLGKILERSWRSILAGSWRSILEESWSHGGGDLGGILEEHLGQILEPWWGQSWRNLGGASWIGHGSMNGFLLIS